MAEGRNRIRGIIVIGLAMLAAGCSVVDPMVAAPAAARKARDAAVSDKMSTPKPDSATPDPDAGAQLEAGPGETATDADVAVPCPHAADSAHAHVSQYEAGVVAIPPFIADRSAVTSAGVGARVLWIFGMPDAQMAAWGSAETLLSSPPHLDEHAPFVPLFPVDAVPAGSQVAVGSALGWSDREALIFFAAGRGLFVDRPGLARIQLDSREAEVWRPAGQLFPPPEVVNGGPAPWTPIFMTGALAVEEGRASFVYLYACGADPKALDEQDNGAHPGPCRVARVPRADVSDGASYRYWNGSAWVDDVHEASFVIDHVQTGLSVSYNQYLGKYLAVHTLRPNAIMLQWADRPEGPWHVLSTFPTKQSTTAFDTTIFATEHPALRDACHQVTYLSYVNPYNTNDDAGMTSLHFETRLLRLRFE